MASKKFQNKFNVGDIQFNLLSNDAFSSEVNRLVEMRKALPSEGPVVDMISRFESPDARGCQRPFLSPSYLEERYYFAQPHGQRDRDVITPGHISYLARVDLGGYKCVSCFANESITSLPVRDTSNFLLPIQTLSYSQPPHSPLTGYSLPWSHA